MTASELLNLPCLEPQGSTAADHCCLPAAQPPVARGRCLTMPLLPALLSHPCASQLQVLGAKRKNLAGYSTASVQPHQGFVFQSDIVQQTPPAFRKKAAKVVGSKCTLLARMDAYGQDPSGAAGQQMKVGSPFKTLSAPAAGWIKSVLPDWCPATEFC